MFDTKDYKKLSGENIQGQAFSETLFHGEIGDIGEYTTECIALMPLSRILLQSRGFEWIIAINMNTGKVYSFSEGRSHLFLNGSLDFTDFYLVIRKAI